jgi:hypothetical protein
MPFKKLPDGRYVSPSGKVMTEKQVQVYYAKRDEEEKSKPKPKKKRGKR